MITPTAKAILCPRVIGRTAHVEVLVQQLAHTRSGQGTTLVIAGEAGIGKSRLVKETKTLALGAGFTCLQGNCFETDRTLPYAPLLDLLRAFVAPLAAETLGDLLSPYAAEFTLLLPELARLWPDVTPALGGDPEQEKRRLFQTLARFLRDLGRDLGLDPDNAVMLAHTLKRLGNWYMNVEHLPEAIQNLNEALSIFTAQADKEGMAETLDLLGIAHFSNSNAIEGAHCHQSAYGRNACQQSSLQAPP